MTATVPTLLTWSEFRQFMPVVERWAYFDHAAVAPLSAPARDAIANWLREVVHDGDTVWPDWMRRLHAIRKLVAETLGASPQEIAFVPNTTSGLSLVAEGFPWNAGDNVVLFANEFPANQYPWLNLASRGVETRRVPVENGEPHLDRLFAACDGRTRLVSASWVGYATGWRLDLDELVQRAHERGVLVMVDAIQGLGVLPLDLEQTPIDFLAADGHKWLLGPEGAGVFFCREKHLDLLRPIGVGWNSVARSTDYGRIDLDLRKAASRYEGGTSNTAGVLGLGASWELLVRAGWRRSGSTVAERVLSIAGLAAERLASVGATVFRARDERHQSGIVSFAFPNREPQELRRHCLSRGVVLSCRDGRLRISPHLYNDEADVERLIAGLV